MKLINKGFNISNNSYSNNPNRNQMNKSNITFGYDADANNELRSLATKRDDFTLIELQETCNSIETEIRRQESDALNNDDEDASSIKYDLNRMETIFYPLKIIVTTMAEKYYKEVNFAKREAESYNKELEKKEVKTNWNSSLWRLTLAQQLSDKDISINKNLTNSSKVPTKYEISSHSKEIPQINIDNKCTMSSNKTPVIQDDSVKKSNNIPENTPIVPNNENIQDKVPSILEEYKPTINSPKGFKDIAGMDEIKEDLMDMIINPFTSSSAKSSLAEYGLPDIPNGTLLYGPSGCGKTYLAEAIAAETGFPMFKLKISLVGTKFIHETSNNIQTAIDYVENRAIKDNKPCILFIDEFDSIANNRTDISGSSSHKKEEISTLLDAFNNIGEKNIILIAATNYKETIDPAILRPGRFDMKISLGLPHYEARTNLINLILKDNKKASPIKNNPDAIDKIAKATNGFTNAEIKICFTNAARKARKTLREMTDQDVLNAVKILKEEKAKEASIISGIEQNDQSNDIGIGGLYI